MLRKPTRRDLLVVVGRLQDLIGQASASHGNDRDPDGFEKGMKHLETAFRLCVNALGHDPPIASTGPWASTEASEMGHEFPVNMMTIASIKDELPGLKKMFKHRHDGAGSPGEWIVERMDELETELCRRARAVRRKKL